MIKTLNVWRDRQIYSEEQLIAYAPPPLEYDSESVSTNVTEVLESLRKLDYPPSADAEVRHKIASYSEMIATPQSLDTIRNSAEAKKLLAEIDEAEPLVKEYCQRLADEMLERRNLQKLFDDMIVNVRATVDLHERMLKEVRRKEERARNDLAEVSLIQTAVGYSTKTVLFSHNNSLSLITIFSMILKKFLKFTMTGEESVRLFAGSHRSHRRCTSSNSRKSF
ncbi:hypothetical protein ANCDUO_00969 [Ancylostoma duodenale]|uniref:RPRD1A/B C-terminal domain-containing protein n=1 Tax=Ancylostoma duodenale TaxID=51022 RepID=A0A0C2H4D9_9BILA|nr:hypothetical protein ANCDUO_00969 [Ancylostoma duodenale]